MISKSVTGQCASEDIGPLRRLDFEIPYRLEKGTSASQDVVP